jgi:hypothetical protein
MKRQLNIGSIRPDLKEKGDNLNLLIQAHYDFYGLSFVYI